jgi:hypothetical protein
MTEQKNTKVSEVLNTFSELLQTILDECDDLKKINYDNLGYTPTGSARSVCNQIYAFTKSIQDKIKSD